MHTPIRLLAVLMILLGATAVPAPAAAQSPPRAVASIKPVYSLLAAVMQGVEKPALLLRGAQSPHTYSLRPSDANLLHRAQFVVWVGPALEGFLVRPLGSLGHDTRILTLMRVPGMALLPARRGGEWEAGAEKTEKGSRTQAGAGTMNPHLWLDPGNAAVAVDAIVRELGSLDPAHRDRYESNGAAYKARIAALDRQLRAALAPVRKVPYVVFHDAYQYFEHRYGLDAVGAISVSGERMPGARRILRLREHIRRLGVRCVFREPEFPSSIVNTVAEHLGVRTGVLDPIGVDIEPGPDAYLTLLRNLAESLRSCLGPT